MKLRKNKEEGKLVQIPTYLTAKNYNGLKRTKKGNNRKKI